MSQHNICMNESFVAAQGLLHLSGPPAPSTTQVDHPFGEADEVSETRDSNSNQVCSVDGPAGMAAANCLIRPPGRPRSPFDQALS
jgi:hypothetical protein